MEQIGTVKKTEGTIAVVEVMRASACGENCAHCKGGCVPTKMNATAENPIGAKAGQRVKIETEDAAVIKASLLLYFVPCVLAIFGAVFAQSVFSLGAVTVLSALVLFLLSFFIIRKLDKKIAPKSRITKILRKEE